MSKKIVVLRGSDPELFTRNLKTGAIGSMAGLLGCDKWNKKPMEGGLNIQEDNVLIEFDIAPQSELEKFCSELERGILTCDKLAQEVGHEIVRGVCSHVYSEAEIKSFHPGALVFGCEPDYNALTGMANPKPKAADPGLRTAGGHVHIGYMDHLPEGIDPEMSKNIMGVMCDYHLGLPSLLMDPDDRRRELYGKAGAIRLKPYGIEYRTLSNFWIFDKGNRQIVWEQTSKAFDTLHGDEFQRLMAMLRPQEVQRIINENDKKAAEAAIKLLGVI